MRKLVNKQDSLCPVCKNMLTIESNMEIHHRLAKALGGSNSLTNLMVLHKTCHKQVTNCRNPAKKAEYVKEWYCNPTEVT